MMSNTYIGVFMCSMFEDRRITFVPPRHWDLKKLDFIVERKRGNRKYSDYILSLITKDLTEEEKQLVFGAKDKKEEEKEYGSE